MAEETVQIESNEITIRPIDAFYGNRIQVVTLSFDNLPEIDCAVADTWNKFLANLWDDYFPETHSISTFLRYCAYHVGLVGKFYKINLIVSLDNLFYLLRDKLPNPDSFNIWHTLHKLARSILIEMSKESASDIYLIYDCHTSRGSNCDNSERMEDLLHDDLPEAAERFLVHHITIKYSRNNRLMLACSRQPSNIEAETKANDSVKDVKDKPEDSVALKSSESPNRPDSIKLSSDSKSSDPWEKYGARPKDKRYLKKSHSDTKKDQKEDDKLNSYKNSTSVDPRLSENNRRARSRARLSDDIDRMNKLLEEKSPNKHGSTTGESSDLSFPPRPIMKNTKPFSGSCSTSIELDNSIKLKNSSDPRKNKDYASPSCSSESSSKHFVSPAKDSDYFKRLVDEYSAPEHPQSISDSNYFAPLIPSKSDHDVNCRKFGAWVDEHGNRRCCKPNKQVRNTHKANEILRSRRRPVMTDKSSGNIDVICRPDFSNIKDLNKLLLTEQQLSEMPEEMREVQKKYEEAIKDLLKDSGSEVSIPSSGTEQVAEANRNQSMEMPVISLQHIHESSETQSVNVDLYVRESMLRHTLKQHFENLSSTFPETKPLCDSSNLQFPDLSDFLKMHDKKSSLLTIKPLDDEVSSNREQSCLNKRLSNLENPNQRIFADKTEKISDDKNVHIDTESLPLDTAGEKCDSEFHAFVQRIAESSLLQRMSSERRENIKSSTQKEHSTPSTETSSLTSLEKKNEETNPQEDSDDESLYYLSDESLNLSDCDGSLGSVSDLEDNDKT